MASYDPSREAQISPYRGYDFSQIFSPSQSEVFLSSRAEGYGGGYIFNRADITSEGFKAEGYGERISLGYGASGSGPLDLSGGLNVSDIFG